MGSIAPDRGTIEPIILHQVLGPARFAGCGIQAKQVAHGAQGIDLASTDDGRGAWPTRVGDGVRTVVVVFPEELAVVSTQAQESFHAGDAGARRPLGFALGVQGSNAIHDVDTTASD